MLRGETHTGVTLQTLHPTEFDAGVVLDQTPEPGVSIPNPTSYSYADLRNISAAMAAEMLVKAIRERSFIPPYRHIREGSGKRGTRAPSFAPKIEPRMRCLDFLTMDSSQILRMNRALAPLWAEARFTNGRSTTSVIFDSDIHLANPTALPEWDRTIISTIEPGLPFVLLDEQNRLEFASAPIMINTIDGKTLIVPTLKMPGTTYRPAAALAKGAALLTKSTQQHGERIRAFHKPLRAPDDIRPYVKSLWDAAGKIT